MDKINFHQMHILHNSLVWISSLHLLHERLIFLTRHLTKFLHTFTVDLIGK